MTSGQIERDTDPDTGRDTDPARRVSLRNGTPNRGYLAGGRHWSGRDGRRDTAGENSRNAKLTEADVLAIRARPMRGPGSSSRAELAVEYGVSLTTIARVRAGQAWGHVKGEGT